MITQLEARLPDYLNDLRLLAGIDSGPHQKEGANQINDWIEKRLSRLGFSVSRHTYEATGDTLKATLRGTGQANIVLMGHCDTVYPAGTAAEHPLTIEGDKILGPGTCDMKAGLLNGIYAIEALQAQNFTDFGTLTYLCVADEERDMRDAVPQIRETVRGQDAVLNLEAARDNGDIVTARKGSLVVWVTAHGRSAHAGVEPEKGRSAIMAMVRKLPYIEAMAQYEQNITLNIGTFNGGTVTNVIPAKAKISIDVRAFHQAELDAVRQQIAAIFSLPDPTGVTFTLQFEDSSPPMPRTDEIARLEALAQAAAQEFGFTVRGARTGGAADSAFAAAEGVPVLDGLGPIGGLDHSPDEYILQSSIVPRTAMLARLMMLICGERDG